MTFEDLIEIFTMPERPRAAGDLLNRSQAITALKFSQYAFYRASAGERT